MSKLNLNIDEATLLLVQVVLRQNGTPDATMNDATNALFRALTEITK